MNRHVLPSYSERTSSGVVETNPYNKLFEERIVFLGVQIDDTSANDVIAQILTLESIDPDRDISLYINSPGGSFSAMTAIYDTMGFVRPHLWTVCVGQAYGEAAVLLSAGAPGRRSALPHARMALQQPAIPGSRGTGSDLEIQAQEIFRRRAQLEAILAHHTRADIAQISRDIERDKIFTAEQARTYGLIDDVLASRKRLPTLHHR
jgi:ATP-dependent Clp protease, protease subunit